MKKSTASIYVLVHKKKLTYHYIQDGMDMPPGRIVGRYTCHEYLNSEKYIQAYHKALLDLGESNEELAKKI